MEIEPESVELVVTSPPYWTLKRYNEQPGQLGEIEDYDEFLDELDDVWRRAHSALVPGGRMVVVVGDVNVSRKAFGRHLVFPLHASIQERCRLMGFAGPDGLTAAPRPSATGLASVDRLAKLDTPTIADYCLASAQYIREATTVGSNTSKAAQLRLSNGLSRALVADLRAAG